MIIKRCAACGSAVTGAGDDSLPLKGGGNPRAANRNYIKRPKILVDGTVRNLGLKRT